jgi:phage baseplate assembly protein W
MAKVVIQGLPQKTNTQQTYTYADLHLDLKEKYLINNPLNQKPEINDFQLDYDIEAIKNSLYNLFTTSPGDKILNPRFGLDLRQFVFEPITSNNAFLLQRLLYEGIEVFEPRVTLRSITVQPKFDDMEYEITVVYSVPTLNISNARLFGRLNKNGYNYI